PFFHFFLLQVIWVLGWAMVVLAGLSYLPLRAVVAIGVVIVVGHNLLDGFDRGNFGQLEPAWNLFHERAMVKLADRRIFVSYPLLPWVGVIALGYGVGSWYAKPAPERQRLLRLSGLGMLLGFIGLRALNVYGDPHPWSFQARSGFTLLSFLNCEKYPPSLLFLLMTLGPALLLLAALEGRLARAPQPLVVFGRVPLFFYVAHLYLLRLCAAPLALMRFGKSAFKPPPGHAGSPEFPLWAAYIALITAVLLLYPACRWFARKKAESKSPWLSYL
ncbi:MAG TPA: heparan-alpha-glucosaminide N-acetyltransferase domain-containing protein, partial [Polyangiaceae bacterium]|nr:heparan-alpha-glucosaminide N-acetyltransferase domain-containing protein [Polyangiaceae bacterium]